MLENSGNMVIESSTADATIRLWDYLRSNVALLLTDIVLNSGVNGNELVKRLRTQQPDLKVVYMSGHSPERLAHLGLDLQEGQNFLHKPFDLAQLSSIISRQLAQ